MKNVFYRSLIIAIFIINEYMFRYTTSSGD